MSWGISFCGLLLLTSLTGSLGLLAWGLIRRPLARCGSLRRCQAGLWAVALLYLVPVLFAAMAWRVARKVSWGGVLFLPTPVLVRFCLAADLIWLLGALWMGSRLMGDMLAVRRLIGSCVECSGWMREVLEQAGRELGIPTGRVRLCQGGSVMVPAFVGLRHPTVLFPEMEYTREQLFVALLHELTHYKQGDYPLLLLVRVVGVVHFWNPFAWQLNRLAEQWSEFACDARVCERAGGMKCYYGAIVDLLEGAGQKGRALQPGLIRQPGQLPADLGRQLSSYLSRSGSEIMRRMTYVKQANAAASRPLRGTALLGAAALLSVVLAALAAEGVGTGYQIWYRATQAEVELISPLQPETAAYTDDGPASYLVVVQGTEELLGALHVVSGTVPKKTMKQQPEFFAEAGDQIAVTVYVGPTDRGGNLKAGLVDSAGNRIYISGNDVMDHVFCIQRAGTYRFFLENQNFVPMEAKGIYRRL